jgi:hypothetical protein
MKAVLDDLTGLAQELRQSFPLHPDDRFGGISRMPAHLHLLYYQVRVQGVSYDKQYLQQIDYRRCDTTLTLLLRQKIIRISPRSRAPCLIEEDQTAFEYVT